MAKKKIPLFIAPAKAQAPGTHTPSHSQTLIVQSMEMPTLEQGNLFHQKINPRGQTAWVLLSTLPLISQRTAKDWILAVHILIKQICGFATIPIDDFRRLSMSYEDVIGNEDWEYLQASMTIGFRPKAPAAQIQFGDEKPAKKKKVEAKYVWASLL